MDYLDPFHFLRHRWFVPPSVWTSAGSAGGSWGRSQSPSFAGALGPIAGRPFNPLKVTDDGAGEDTTGSKTTGTYNIWCLELHFAGGGTALGRPGNLFLGFLRGDNVDKVATGRLSMIMDIVRSVKRTLATCVERLDSRALIGTLIQISYSSAAILTVEDGTIVAVDAAAGRSEPAPSLALKMANFQRTIYALPRRG
ncbi:hypothetical protein THAOC_28267 [Thalassiosira oceanica]|uniref:Uncharacterized protein n=1 Tax=Thalassiosira oceanica TaxID=159749 RepID=K0S0M6_THAOC|nr:hypothetical protein THAOC_28267 [Thalassiosira oceanica]|eukprot:EJK52452.1 hypothetical protein THAOC_28267 [Thalassiosira oceanica]